MNDKKTNIVKIPPYMVEEAIRSAPSRLLLAARNPKYDIILESNRVAYTNFGVAIEDQTLRDQRIYLGEDGAVGMETFGDERGLILANHMGVTD